MKCLRCNNELLKNQEKRGFKFCCKGCAISFRQSFHDPDIFCLSENILYYIVGFIWSDGNLSASYDKITISNNDNEIINKIKPLFCDVRRKIYFCGKNASIINTNKINISKLMNLGLVPNKSYIINYPPISENGNSHFIRGIFDGDGCVYVSSVHKGKKYLNVSITSGSYLLLQGIQEVLKNQDIASNIYKDSRINCNTYYLKIIKQESVRKFYYFIYKDNFGFFINCKQEIFLNNNIV